MYGQESPRRRSLDDLWDEMGAEASAPVTPKPRPKPRRSLDELWDETQRYGPPVTPDMLPPSPTSPAVAPTPDSPVGKPMMFTAPDVDASGRETGRGMVTTKPEGVAPLAPKRDPRQVQAARVARQINDLKKQSVSFFQQADQTPDTPANGGLNSRQQLRAKAEGSLEQANMLAKDAQGRYGDLLEVGYGNDADPDSKRKWAYAKVKPHAADALVEQDRMRLREHDARTMDALNVSPEAKARFAQDRKDDILRNIVGAVNPAVGLGDALANLGITEPREGINRFYRGATNMLASLPEGAARMVDRALNTGSLAEANALQKILDTDTSLTPEERQATQQKIQQLYGSLSNLGETPAKLTDFGEVFTDTAYPIDQSQPDTYNPLKARFYSRTLPAAAGSMLPFMASAGAGSAVGLPAEVVAGLTGAAGEVPGQYREAKAAGANPQQQARAVDAGMLAGFLESFGAESLMGKLPGKGRLSGIAKEALQEGIQEGAQQAVENVGAKYYAGYDPNRPLTEDVLANAVPALFLGGAGGAASHVSGHTQEHQTAQNRNIIDARSAANAAALQAGTPPTSGIVPTTIGPTQITKLPGARPAVTETQNQPAVAPATPQAVTTPSTPQPTASLFPEAQPVAPPPDLTKLSPQERTAALLDQLRQQQEGRGRATLEQSLNQEFTEAGGMVTAAAQNWDTDRPTAEQLAATGAQRLKTALNTLQKSEPYQAELAAVSQGTGQPGAYIGAAQRLQQQIAQADGLFRLDAEREQQQADAEKAQKKADKEAAKQERIQLKEQAKLDRQTAVQQRRDESAARRMQAAETAKTVRRKQLEEQRQQARDTKVQQRADAELQRMGRHDAALKAADEANRRHQEYLNQGMIPEAVNELVVQQNQLRDAVRYLPATPQSQNIKADLNRYQGQIGNRIGDLRKQARGQSGPVTEAIPPLLRPDAVVNESGGVPNLPSFYRPGAVFDKLNPTLGDVEEETTPMLTAVRRLGGIRNDQITPGELRRLGIKESGTTGLVNEKGGLAPDRMREALVESGYLPEDSTVDDLYQAIEGELRGGRRSQPKGGIAEFYDQWEAENSVHGSQFAVRSESQETSTEKTAPQSAIRNPQSGRSPIEQFADDVEADDMAALKRSLHRSRAENPRAYNEKTRPGQPGGVSFSPFADLETNNREAVNRLFEIPLNSAEARQIETDLRQFADSRGIEQRHVDAVMAYAANHQINEASQEDIDERIGQALADARSADETLRQIREAIRPLPAVERTAVEREIAAIDAMFEDEDMRNLLDEAVDGNDDSLESFLVFGDRAYGLTRETAQELVRTRQEARRASKETRRRDVARRNAQRTSEKSEAPKSRNLDQLDQLLSRNPAAIPDAQFDAYLRDLEGWRNEGIHGPEFGGVDLPPSLERSLRQKLAATNEERKTRVKENRLKPKHTPLPIPTQAQRAERQQLIAETRDLSPEEQQQRMSDLHRRQRESGEQGQPVGKEELGRQMREQVAGEARTVNHPDPKIDGKPVLAETKDGRVIVENPDNAGGISVVKDRGSNSETETEVPILEIGMTRRMMGDFHTLEDVQRVEGVDFELWENDTKGGKTTIVRDADTGEAIGTRYDPDGDRATRRHTEDVRVARKRAETLPEKSESKPATPKSERGRLAYAVADHLASDGKFANIIEARKFIAQQTGQTAKAGTIEAKQVDEAIEAGTVIAARRIVAEGRLPRETFQSLLGLYNRQPNLSARTSTSMLQQAYSTPLPLAYVAAQLAGINQNTTVYEPSAGHSALLVTAKPENIVANELNAERAAAVRDILPGATVTEHDAADWKPAKSVDRVITNPPFGAVKDANGQNRRFKIDGKYETSEIDHAIAFEALKAMKDDGKAVLIVGGLRSEVESARSNAYNTGAKRNFYFTLYNQYNVTDHFTVAGELYNKQGAGWPVDVIVIDGRGKSQRELPAVAVPQILRSWGEVEGKLNAASSRNSQSAESTAENVRLGERGLSASERSSGASRRTADNERVPVVSDRPGERDVEIRRNAGAVDAGVSDQSTGTSRPVEPASESSQFRRGTERTDLQQRPAARPAKRAERVSEPDNAQQGQPARKTTGQGNQPGTVDQRTDRGTGRTPFVAQSKTYNQNGWQIDARTEDGGETAVLTAYNFHTGREEKLTFSPANYEGTVKSGGSLLDSLKLQGKYGKDERLQLSSVLANVVTSLKKEITAKQSSEETSGTSANIGNIFDEEFDKLFGETTPSQAKPTESKLNKTAENVRETKNAQPRNLFDEESQQSALTPEYRQMFDQTIGRYVDTYKTQDIHAQLDRLMDNDAALAALADYLKEKRPDLAKAVDQAHGALTAEAPEEGAFSPAQAVQLVADSTDELRKQDVYRLLDETAEKDRIPLANYIIRVRGDLAAETRSVMSELGVEGYDTKTQKAYTQNDFESEVKSLSKEVQAYKDSEAKPRTTKQAAKSAAKESKDTLKEIAKGLSDLFGGPKLSSGLTFDEKTYAAAKPHFEAAMEHFQHATRDVREVMANLLKELNQRFGFQPDALQRMKPYIVRFVEEKTSTQTESAIRNPQSAIEQATQAPATTTGEADAGASDTHRAYAPASGQKSVGTLVPVNMADAVSNSLNRLKDEVGDLDEYVGEKLGYKASDLGQYLSGEQVDAVAMAIRNIENGGALILGDQTGIGKGRVVAAVIRYAVKQGLTPVFVTEKPTLYGDMIRDLTDIGSENIKPLITNSGESVPLDDDALDWYGEAEKARLEDRPVPKKRGRFLETKGGPEHNALLKRAADSGNLAGYHVIFTTYNQMQTVKGQTTARHDLLRRFANNGIVIFDESHNAGGAGKVETDDKGQVKFDRAQFARQLARDAKGLLYSSATFAKRPEVMDLYFRTELGNAVGDLAELSEITQKGGVPMQQVIASMLAEAGQYVRRERSFKGVEYAPTPTKVDRKTAENVSRAMREVADFDRIKQGSVEALGEQVKKEAKRITGDGTVGQAGVHSVNFTSLMHNLIDQSLLAMKVDQAADMAIKALENGEKPVITVANTMGSFIQRFAEENELKPGAPINLSFNDLLDRYLERSREVIVGKPYGEKQRHYLSDEELGEAGVRAYEKAKKTLEGLKLDIPISPIDWLHKRLRDAGYRTGEITGRGHIVNYTADGPVYTTRPASETSTAAKKRTIAAFNDGTMDVIILNQSGSTGISLHASEKFKDQRRRHMIIAQAEKNIDTHMQMLGRVHRTGQVISPRYTQMVADIPAELRPAAVLAKKMASLNANTTASRSSAVTAKDVPDFLNKYGDEVAASMMESNPDLHALLGYPLKDSEKKEGLEREDAMRKVTGRIPLLPIAQQEQAYEDLIDEYNYTLQQAEAMGENALEAKTLNLDAETAKTQTLVPGSGKSVFEQAANLEKIRSNRQGKPFTSNEVLEKVQASTANDARNLVLLGRAGKEQIRSMRSDLEAEVAAFKHRMDEEHGDTKRGAVEQLAANKWMNRWNQITGTVHPGATVQVAGGYGVVLNIERKGKTANPVALSGWRATIALADARRQLSVPFSKIDFETTDQPNRITILPATEATVYDPEKEDFARVPILDAFDKGLSSTKETRYMVTGNLIAGFGAQPNGQIVNFTDNEGRVRQGIMMPAKFDPAETAGKQKQRLKTVDDVMGALTGPVGEVTDRTGDLSIRKAPSYGYVFSVPSAKGRGGKYYLNRSLLDAAETDFAKRGGRMEVQVRESIARRMIDTLLTGKGMATSVSLQAKAPQVAERRGGAPLTDRYTVRDLATNATAEYRPASNRPGAVYLNDWGHALVRDTLATVYGEGVAQIPGDFTLDTAAIRSIADGMRDRAGGAFTDIANALETAAKDADVNGRDVAIVTKRQGQSMEEIKRSVRHETVHTAQSAIDPTLTGAATEAWLSSQPKASEIRKELTRRGYADDTHGYEAVAYVASGDFGVFGLSLDEATDLLDSYYRATVRKFGASALGKFGAIDPKLQPTLEGVRRETQTGRANTERGTEIPGRSDRSAQRPTTEYRAGAFDSTQEREGRTEGLPRIAERKDRRFSFGELESEPKGTVLGSGFGGLQSLVGQKTPRTTPLREIVAEHKPLIVNPLEIQNRAIKEVLDAAGRGVTGTLPGARALYWAKKLKAKPIADKLANRQARFIEDAITKTNQIISTSEAMNAAERGSKEYQKAKADFYKARRELHNQLQGIGEYSGPVEYLTKYAKGAILTAPHILTNNVLDHLASFPFHEAQKLMGFLLPVRALRRWGVNVERTHVDFRDLVPALAREFGAILKGTKDAMPDFVHALRYGTTDLLLDEEIAREQLHQTEEDRQTGGADRYEFGKRAKGVPGLDQALSAVGRMHGAVDVAGRRWAFATAITSQADAIAKRVGKENGFSKQDIAALRDDLAAEPSPQMIVLAMDEANRFVLDYPTFLHTLVKSARKIGEKEYPLANKTFNNALDFIVKFQKIPLAAQAQSLWHYTPMGLVGQAARVRQAAKAKAEGTPISARQSAEIVERLQQGALGTLVWAGVGLLGSLGYLQFTGGDDRQRVRNAQEALEYGYDPELIIGDKALTLNKLGTFGRAGSVAARLAKAAEPRKNSKTGETESEDTRAKRVGKAFMKGVVFDNPIGRGVGELVTSDSGDPLENFARGQIRSLQPGFLRDVAKLQDGSRRIPDKPDFQSKVEADLKTGNPWYRQTLQPRKDALGQNVPEDNPFSFSRTVKNNPQLEEMIRLGTGLPKPKRERGESSKDYNQRVEEQGSQTIETMRKLAADTRMAGRSDEAKARIYNSELTPSVMKRADKLSDASVETEREIEAIRADAYEALRKLPSYQTMKDSDKEKARSFIDAQLKGYRARAANKRAREKSARLPEFQPVDLAQSAVEQIQR